MNDDGTCINCNTKMTYYKSGFYRCKGCGIEEYPDLSMAGKKADLHRKVTQPAILNFIDSYENEIRLGSILAGYSFLMFMVGVCFILALL